MKCLCVMDTKNKNEELQSRRDFFKKAARGALPILGAVVLSSMPNVIKAAEESPMGCAKSSCYQQCADTCRNYCNGTCVTTCKNLCKNQLR